MIAIFIKLKKKSAKYIYNEYGLFWGKYDYIELRRRKKQTYGALPLMSRDMFSQGQRMPRFVVNAQGYCQNPLANWSTS